MELNKIYNENCLDTMARMPDNFIDLTVTSPPYDNLRSYKNGVGDAWNFETFKPIARELFRVTKPGGVVVWVVADATINGSETGTSFRQALYFKEIGFNLHDTMIYKCIGGKPQNPVIRYNQDWEFMFVFSKGKPKVSNIKTTPKTNIRQSKSKRKRGKENEFTRGFYFLGGGPISSVWDIKNGFNHSTKDKEAFKHPAIFPERLAADHIKSWSNEGNLIYDPFGGSGTTAKMCHKLKRNWILSEISEEYCQIANKRILPYLMQKSLF